MEAPSEQSIPVATGVFIPLAELEWRFSASGGPGGQHVNTSNTRAEVRWSIEATTGIRDAHLRDRLLGRLGPLVSVVAADERSQLRNRNLALDRLRRRVADALVVDRPRHATRPSRSAQRRRVEAKRRQGDLKASRRFRAGDE
jgi:ribosome-associated protein